MTILYTVGLAAFAVLSVYLLIKLLAAPIKGLVKFLLHAGSGLLFLVIVDFVGGFFDFYIPLAWPSLLAACIGGPPGVALLALYHLLWG